MPLMCMSGISIKPGTEVQVSVTPTVFGTTEKARARFSPVERRCYFDEEIELSYLPEDEDYRYQESCLTIRDNIYILVFKFDFNLFISPHIITW